jgi:hypothetical protein
MMFFLTQVLELLQSIPDPDLNLQQAIEYCKLMRGLLNL